MTPEPPITVFVTVANVDGLLPAYRWSQLQQELVEMLDRGGAKFAGEWFSAPLAELETTSWCATVAPGVAERLKGELAAIAVSYGRGMIGWSEVAGTAILG